MSSLHLQAVGGVDGRGMVLNHFCRGFQLSFTFITVFKALDSDLHFVVLRLYGATCPLLVHT